MKEKEILKRIIETTKIDIETDKRIDKVFSLCMYHAYGVKMDRPKNINGMMYISISVPEYSEIDLNDKEASNIFLIKEFYKKAKEVIGECIKLESCIRRGEIWSFQDAANILPNLILASRKAKDNIKLSIADGMVGDYTFV